MATTRFIDYDATAVEKARQAVIDLTRDSAPSDVGDLFFTDSLEKLEDGIRRLNEFSSKCWILSALILYTIVYDKEMYQQSGLQWHEYSKEARSRLGLDPREITEQLAAARFFVRYRDALLRYGWTTSVPKQSLARGELALELSGNIDDTIRHMVGDTQKGFREWYQSFKALPVLPIQDARPDIEIGKTRVRINGIDAVTISDSLPPEQRVQIEGYIADIFQCLKSGDVPAIIPVYDDNEARHMITLRDRYREGR